jgi:hypothetical protein
MSPIGDTITLEMVHEVRAMTSHALAVGIAVPGWVLDTVVQAESAAVDHAEDAVAETEPTAPDLYKAHAELTKLVAPFTPDLIIMLEMDLNASSAARALGQVRIARYFMIILLASIGIFLAVSVSPYLNDPRHGDIFTSSGWPLFINELFFITTAAVGASFSNLFQINRELTRGTFVPKNQSSYWVQFTLGLVAGLLLSTLLNVNSVAPAADAAASKVHFRAAALALIGGFSSTVVQRIIQRLIDALESVLRGSSDLEIEAREKANRQDLDEQLAKDRMRTALLLVEVQRRLAAGESPEAVRALLDQASQAVLSNDQHPMEDAPPMLPGKPKETPAGQADLGGASS